MDSNYICDYNDTKNYRARKGTIRKCSNRYAYADYAINVKRPYFDNTYPVTEIDFLLDSSAWAGAGADGMNVNKFNVYKTFSLRKNGLFDTFINDIEEIAVNRVESVDIARNQKIICYSVPACGHFGTPGTIKSTWPHNWYETTGRYISIGGIGYWTKNYYVQSGDIYTKLNVPKSYWDNPEHELSNLLTECEQTYCAKSGGFVKSNSSFTMGYHHDIPINCVIICPERLRFNMVHADNSSCAHNCSKSKHCIQVLTNNPGYITRFNLYYRSSNTDGKWIGLGIYDGCRNMYEPVKVYFDTIMAKEIRIVPIASHGTISKCKVMSVGPTKSKQVVSKDTVVKYTLMMPLTGIPRQTSVSDNYVWSHYSKDYKYYYTKLKRKELKNSRAKITSVDDIGY